ncbi:MAG: IclR family transcriptional regulator [Actinomycetota bacterium]
MTPPQSPSTTVDALAPGPVERAFSLLQAVVIAGEPIGVRELGRRVGLPRSTVSRLVATLTDLGMVERTADRLVVPGSALATLQLDGGPTPLLRDRLRPLLAELADLHPESVTLAVDDGDAVLYLVQLDAASAVRAPDVHAERHPFHVAAFGLVLMATWDDERLDRYLAEDLAAFTPHSMTDPAHLRRRLEAIRRDGAVWTTEEYDDEVNGLAAVVTDVDGNALASVGYFGPAYRLNRTTCPDLADDLVAAVAGRANP